MIVKFSQPSYKEIIEMVQENSAICDGVNISQKEQSIKMLPSVLNKYAIDGWWLDIPIQYHNFRDFLIVLELKKIYEF